LLVHLLAVSGSTPCTCDCSQLQWQLVPAPSLLGENDGCHCHCHQHKHQWQQNKLKQCQFRDRKGKLVPLPATVRTCHCNGSSSAPILAPTEIEMIMTAATTTNNKCLLSSPQKKRISPPYRPESTHSSGSFPAPVLAAAPAKTTTATATATATITPTTITNAIPIATTSEETAVPSVPSPDVPISSSTVTDMTSAVEPGSHGTRTPCRTQLTSAPGHLLSIVTAMMMLPHRDVKNPPLLSLAVVEMPYALTVQQKCWRIWLYPHTPMASHPN